MKSFHPEKLLMQADSSRLIRVRAFIPPQIDNKNLKTTEKFMIRIRITTHQKCGPHLLFGTKVEAQS